jgi:DNA helicase-2/ATP-dependent DNA helicase PcrA
MSQMALNKKQIMAVEHLNGPMMVLAGPGSGKTTVITYRVRHLIEKYNVNPDKILVITFTKSAADEMALRFKNLEMKNNLFSNKVTFGTFHSIFFRIIRSAIGYKLEDVLKEDERKILLKNIINSLNIEYEDEEEFLRELSSDISLMKNELIDPKYYNSMACSAEDYRRIVSSYEQYKTENNKIDFDDMLCICWKTLQENKECLSWWQNRYEYILIDEFQDINRVQYETIGMLANQHKNIFIVGDDDQSIYKFRGARPEFLLKFPEDFDNVISVILDINYRSTDEIIAMANKIVVNNKSRYDKNIVGTNRKGAKPISLCSQDIEAEALLIANHINKLHKQGMPWYNIAVIFRTNIQARVFVDKFMDMNLPFFIRDEMPNIYNHWIAKDLLAYIRLSMDVNKNEDLERIINKPKRYISKALIQEAKKKSGSLLVNLKNLETTQVWQRQRIEELEFQLNAIKNRNPFDAFKYIRVIIGYDDYIRNYAEFRHVGIKGLFEIADELKESAKKYEKHEEFLTHIDDFNLELKNQKVVKKNNFEKKDAITLTTMHGAKGLEFDAVFIASVVEGVIPHEKSKTPAEIEEERRLFYVGVTRAKQYIYISTVDTRYEEKISKSEFLEEIKFI